MKTKFIIISLVLGMLILTGCGLTQSKVQADEEWPRSSVGDTFN